MGIRGLDSRRRGQTLELLEHSVWPEPGIDTYLVMTCHRLRKKPIGDFTAEDLRIMIGQDVGSMFLVPLALEILAVTPLTEASYFPGDLLCSVISLPIRFWQRHSDLRTEVEAIVSGLQDVPTRVSESLNKFRDKNA